ncbi:unnamed protein product [Brassica oleracea]|uniref:(rape) hypothetical protein n=1 Tax=Brassica napus TaxID=3708 RepID=A0A816KMD0_BRANA|nr:unnamed protein product [Brassica napus]
MLKPQSKAQYIHHSQDKSQINARSDWSLGNAQSCAM